MRADAQRRSAERILATAREFVFASRMCAGLPGDELKAVPLTLMVADVLRVLVIQHPCHQLHSATEGGTCEKHVHIRAPGRPCAAVQGAYNQFHTRYTNANRH